jgi:hypothetical protein
MNPSLWQVTKKNSVYLWAGLAFVPVGAIFLIVGIHLALEERAFANRGATVAATITEKSLVKADFDDHPSTRYLLHYRFTVPEGRSIEETKVVSVEDWERASVGAPREIRVLPGTTAETRLTSNTNWSAVATFLTLGLILIVAGIFVLVIGMREIKRQWQSSRAH